MPHLDEGMLHAYLDDALPNEAELHLRECAECRANLEKARLLKESAGTILAEAAPVGIAMPSFEELQKRAKSRSTVGEETDARQTGAQHRKFSQLRALAWAATVVLAVAVGWYARSTVLQTEQNRMVPESETRGRMTIPLPETALADSDASDEGTQVRMLSVEQEKTSLDTESEERVEEQVSPDVTGGVATVAAATGEAMQAPQEMREVRRMLPQVIAARSAAEPTAMPAAGGRGGAEFNWTPVDEATAASFLDGPVPIVEGVPVVGYATSHLNGSQAIRVLQRLESGRLLELVITPKGDTDLSFEAKKGMELFDAAPGADAESVNTIAVARDNLRIRMSAVLAIDSLMVLGQNIISGR